MSFIVAIRKSEQDIDIYIDQLANFAVSCTMTDTQTGNTYELADGKVSIPANDNLYNVICTATRVADGGSEPRLTATFCQGSDLLKLVGRANPTRIGPYSQTQANTFVMRFTYFLSVA